MDGVLEPEEVLVLALGSPDEQVLISPNMATMTISSESLHASAIKVVVYPSYSDIPW